MNKFWDNTSGSYIIGVEDLHKFLCECGFYTYKPTNQGRPILIKVVDKIVVQVSIDEIRDYCWNYIMGYPFQDENERKQVKDYFIRNRPLFSKDNIILLPAKDLNLVKDTKEKSYLFFNNFILEITKESVVKKSYDDVEGHVFSNDVINFFLNSEVVEDLKPEGEFNEFISDVCKHGNKETEKHNFESLITIIGYYIHRHKDPSNAKAVVFMDSYKDGAANGGTGKGITAQALGKIRGTVFEDGKLWDKNSNFRYSQVKYDTRILVFDDVPKNFDFEKLFPIITEKLVVERKYENKITIPFEDSPKILITTNYTVEGKGDSVKRRKVEFIFSNYYNPENTPETKFGHLLFIDWDQDEWEKFYLFITWCIKSYLEKGLIIPKFNVLERKLKQETPKEFRDYVNNHFEPLVKYDKKKVYDDFYTKFPDLAKVEINTFRNLLKLFSDAYGFGFYETHSGDINYFQFA